MNLSTEDRLASWRRFTPKGDWIMGMGYDDTLVAEMRHPTKADLDAVSTDHKIFILHTSMHMAVGNTAVLDAMDINADTPAPEGGVIEKGPFRLSGFPLPARPPWRRNCG